LEINADAGHGEIRVEVLDEQGVVIPGYELENAEPFSSDQIRGIVRWQGGKNLQGVAGKNIRLVFHMQMAKLYAFRFAQ
jgi:hypothetical protein